MHTNVLVQYRAKNQANPKSMDLYFFSRQAQKLRIFWKFVKKYITFERVMEMIVEPKSNKCSAVCVICFHLCVVLIEMYGFEP